MYEFCQCVCFFVFFLQDPDGLLTHSNRKIEYHHSSQHICRFCTMSKKSTQSIRRCGRGEGCLHHRGSKSLSSQKLIDFTVLMWLSVGLTQARQPLLVLYCMFAELQNWRDTARFKSAKNCVLMSRIVWLIRRMHSDKSPQWYTVNERLIIYMHAYDLSSLHRR